ncbi:unnamed protein product [Ascophyllum nodosum]
MQGRVHRRVPTSKKLTSTIAAMKHRAATTTVALGLLTTPSRSAMGLRGTGLLPKHVGLSFGAAAATSSIFGMAVSSPRPERAKSQQRAHQAAAAGAGQRGGITTTCSAATTGQRELYEQLCGKLREVERLGGVEGLLTWDEQANKTFVFPGPTFKLAQVMMPPGGAASRANQKAALAGVIHEKKVDEGLGEVLRRLEDCGQSTSELSPLEVAVVRDAARDYRHETRKSKDLAAKEAEIESKGYGVWVEAKGKGDWPSFAPIMREMVDVKREVAVATRPELGGAGGGGAYDGCLDRFERGMSAARLREVFDELKNALVPLLRDIQAKVEEEKESGAGSERFPTALHGGKQWGEDEQAALCRDIAERLGFEMKNGRLDVSVHPFTGGPSPSDVRITTRFSSNWVEGISGTVHEVGHALYEQGRPGGEAEDLPVSRALSMGVHESQSLLWERMVFLSRPFWSFAAPLVHARFPHTEGIDAEAFYRGLNRVEPGAIRVDADEVTYPLHVILRRVEFEIEQGLMDGSLAVDDIPAAWTSKMKELLGVDVSGDDAKGCLQDVHWSVGAIGYFPSYTLGAVMACQFFEAARKALPDLDDQLASGNFEPLKNWLNREVHEKGSLFDSPDELLRNVTGEVLQPKALIDHLRSKYADLYGLGN